MAPKKANSALSLAAYARRRGVSGNAVTKAVQSGRLVKSIAIRKGRTVVANVELADREWEINTRPIVSTAEVAASDAAAGLPAVGSSRARFEAARATVAELDLAEKRGELVDASEVAAKFIEVVTVAKTKLLGLATRCKQRMPHLSADDVRIVDDLVREALEDLANGG